METATAAVTQWRSLAPHLRDLRLAVNVSVGPFSDGVWAQEVLDVLAANDLPADALTLEVTKRSLDSTSPLALAALRDLGARGCRVAIDDLGTGTSSLVLLADLPATELKIDRTLITTMATDRKRAALVHAITRLGTGLGLRVVAEGVEDRHTADLVTAAGCTHGQGYLWSAPLAVSDLRRLLLNSSGTHRRVGR